MSIVASQVQDSRSFLIVGLGQTGLSCARFLTQQGYPVAVVDTRKRPPEMATLKQELPEVPVRTGELVSDWLFACDTIVLSPGIDSRLPAIKAACDAGIEVIGDIELFAHYANAPIVAITGSNGKSTVTTMVAEMAVTAGKKVQVGGNLGTPALALITYPHPDFYILELSSFQLETVKSLNADVAVVLNISPDHLDRYDNQQAYQNAKANIYLGAGKMVFNRDDSLVNDWSRNGGRQTGFTLASPQGNEFGLIQHDNKIWLAQGNQRLLSAGDLQIIGSHNIANVLAALALGEAMNLPMPAMLTAIQHYSGLLHRCYLVGRYHGISWFNDSKATNVGACIAAINSLGDSGKIVLIAGGVAKDQDFSVLTPVLQDHVKALVLLGRDVNLIANAAPSNIRIIIARDMFDAVKKAQQLANHGDNVLLSPACASFDMFISYVERGEQFAKAVQEQCQ